MVCPQGAVEVVCDDGSAQRAFVLERADAGLLVPPTIWASVRFRQEHSVLLVVCDRPYEADDYIRDHAKFLAWRSRADTQATGRQAS
jgi:hypothetical protein